MLVWKRNKLRGELNFIDWHDELLFANFHGAFRDASELPVE
jgi:hypothetical protein